MSKPKLHWYEFFAGGGMARLGLGSRWKCIFANEWCPKKASAYESHFGRGNPKKSKDLVVDDVANLATSDLPGHADLAWASFPCQDLSLAGAGAGLKGKRSGTFTPFWKLMEGLVQEGRGPRIIVLENVVGAITSHGGKDFQQIVHQISGAGYRVGAMIIDAIRFLPQSRPRLFIVAADGNLGIPGDLIAARPAAAWHSGALRQAYEGLPDELQQNWVWWDLPEPPRMMAKLSDIVEDEPSGVSWHSAEHTRYLITLMSDVNRKKLAEAQASRARRVGTIYRRTRPTGDGEKQQRAEVRFDEVAGCLRTPAGGSSRQTVILVEGKSVRSRLLSPREAARLMGVPEEYPMPANYNEAYHLFGDGLAVPAVAWLNEHLLLRLAEAQEQQAAA